MLIQCWMASCSKCLALMTNFLEYGGHFFEDGCLFSSRVWSCLQKSARAMKAGKPDLANVTVLYSVWILKLCTT